MFHVYLSVMRKVFLLVYFCIPFFPVCGEESVFVGVFLCSVFCVPVMDVYVYVSCLWSKKVFFIVCVLCMCSGQVFVEDNSVVCCILCVPICFTFIC